MGLRPPKAPPQDFSTECRTRKRLICTLVFCEAYRNDRDPYSAFGAH